jgi:hypothetical protein
MEMISASLQNVGRKKPSTAPKYYHLSGFISGKAKL